MSETQMRLVANAIPRAGTGLESNNFVTEEQVRGLMRERMDMQLDRVDKLVKRAGGRSNLAVDARIRSMAEDAMRVVADGKVWTPTTRATLETLVLLTGRPALRVNNGRIDPSDPAASEWEASLTLASMNGMDKRIASVGRIDIGGIHVGTGFVVGDGLVLTNRHVLQLFAAPVPRRTKPLRWVKTESDVVIDFAEAPSSGSIAARFRILDIVGAGDDDIDGNSIDLADLDVALLRVEATNESGVALPAAMPLVGDAHQAMSGMNLLVVGYPARPSKLPADALGKIDMEVAVRLNEIYHNAYGKKYVSPGAVSHNVGLLPGDEKKWTIGHDATTLGGNSGSCLMSFDDPMGAIGLHFGGVWRSWNYALAFPALKGTNTIVGSNKELVWWL